MMLREGNLNSPAHWPPKKDSLTKNPRISVELSAEFNHNSLQTRLEPGIDKNFRTAVLQAYMESNLFSSVKIGYGCSELRAQIKLHQKGYSVFGALWRFIATLSFHLLPSYESKKYFVETIYEDCKKGVIGIIKKSESLTLWTQVFLIATRPSYHDPKQVLRDTLFDLNRTTLEEASKRGFFSGFKSRQESFIH